MPPKKATKKKNKFLKYVKHNKYHIYVFQEEHEGRR